MITRTAKLYGGITTNTDTNITVQFNNRAVFSGPIEFIGDIDENGHGPVAQWDLPIDEYGEIPCSIIVNDGNFLFITIHTNYLGGKQIFAIKPNAVWQTYVPDTLQQLNLDSKNLSNLEFEAKYGLTKDQARNNVELVETISNTEYYGDPNTTTVESDGKNDVLLDGIPQLRIVQTSEEMGKWYYQINKNQQLDFNYTILPPILNN